MNTIVMFLFNIFLLIVVTNDSYWASMGLIDIKQ